MKRTGSAGRKSRGNAISTSRPRKRPRSSGSHFVVCINNTGYLASLELHKIYRIIPDPGATRLGSLRVVDESGEDYLYPAKWFVPVALPRRIRNSLSRTA
jgi:hypothetical protein